MELKIILILLVFIFLNNSRKNESNLADCPVFLPTKKKENVHIFIHHTFFSINNLHKIIS